MSYSFDRSRAVSLSTQDGVWSLEVEELVRLNRNIFRPRRQRLSGRDAILQHLATNQDVLLQETQRLLDVHVGDDGFRYEFRGTGWVPVPAKQLVEDAVKRQEREHKEGEMLAEVSELRDRVADLEGSVKSIHARLEELLAKGFVPPAEGGPPLAPQPQHDEAADAGELDAPLDLASAAVDEVASAPEAAEPEVVAEKPPPPPEPDFKAIQLPTTEVLDDMVKALVGDEVAIEASSSESWDLVEDNMGYLALLLDDAGEVKAAIVMNLEATVRLAGGMLMEEEETLNAQIAAGEPSEDVMDTAAEVLNTLTSAVNKIKGNPHVRVSELQAIDTSEHPWLCYSRRRDDFQVSIGGRLAVLAR